MTDTKKRKKYEQIRWFDWFPVCFNRAFYGAMLTSFTGANNLENWKSREISQVHKKLMEFSHLFFKIPKNFVFVKAFLQMQVLESTVKEIKK